jgi:hypothetical protein
MTRDEVLARVKAAEDHIAPAVRALVNIPISEPWEPVVLDDLGLAMSHLTAAREELEDADSDGGALEPGTRLS